MALGHEADIEAARISGKFLGYSRTEGFASLGRKRQCTFFCTTTSSTTLKPMGLLGEWIMGKENVF
jgi:hypothetical protein